MVKIPFSMVEVRNKNLDENIFRLFVNETSDNVKHQFLAPFWRPCLLVVLCNF